MVIFFKFQPQNVCSELLLRDIFFSWFVLLPMIDFRIFSAFLIHISIFSALPDSKNLFITGFGHNQNSSSFNIGNVHHFAKMTQSQLFTWLIYHRCYWGHLEVFVVLTLLTLLIFRNTLLLTGKLVQYAPIMPYAHRTFQNREGQL